MATASRHPPKVAPHSHHHHIHPICPCKSHDVLAIGSSHLDRIISAIREQRCKLGSQRKQTGHKREFYTSIRPCCDEHLPIHGCSCSKTRRTCLKINWSAV